MHKENQQEHAPFVIVTAYTGSANDSRNQERLRNDLACLGYNFKTVVGFYEGHHEECILVVVANWYDVSEILRVAQRGFAQKTVLFVDQYRNGTLFGYKPVIAGKWRAVPKIIALSKPAWTLDPATDIYYACD